MNLKQTLKNWYYLTYDKIVIYQQYTNSGLKDKKIFCDNPNDLEIKQINKLKNCEVLQVSKLQNNLIITIEKKRKKKGNTNDFNK